MTSFFDLTLPQLTERLESWGEPRYRAKQIWQAAYRDLVQTPEQMTTLPHPLREKLKAELIFGSLSPAAEAKSSDHQTRKILFRLPDGKQIETVLMGYERRHTTCISTQAGCAMGCVFCATGQMGFRRHLSAGEIVEQVLWFARALRPSTAPRLRARGSAQGAQRTLRAQPELVKGSPSDHLTNIVIMGMGEPFHNYDATLAAIDLLNHPEGFNFGARRITLSTVGLPPMIERFAAEKRQVNLAVSLHAATDRLRTELLPINKKYPLPILFAAIRNYFETTKRRVTFEWALIQGKNDTPEQARALADLARGLPCHVNVIPLNPTRNYAGAASTRQRAAAFKALLEAHGIPCTIRVRRGIDINAGCGQLAGEKELTSA